jgi:hypothetical protein
MNETRPSGAPRFAVCICNDGYPAALELHKVYQVLPDPFAEQIGWMRIVDESGEDYLYPGSFFQPIEVSHALREELLRAS